ncbi:aldehyde dehydrogenase family protein [Acaricomes phytoseiuli]|uniref:aldehyde dehydrogenase family protein n=1 Tax=Acaricomes phytoseiuli TaxID=291968 RepID=UPI0003619E5C|nr:aldehyde dehydrogenase family protein [Acaricomes phytoseiuli]
MSTVTSGKEAEGSTDSSRAGTGQTEQQTGQGTGKPGKPGESGKPSAAEAAAAAVAAARGVFDSGATRSLDWRVSRLRDLQRMLTENTEEFLDALQQDLAKPVDESWLTEVGFTGTELSHTLKHLRRWLRPERTTVPLALQPASARIAYEPYGVVLIITPWNYPVQLALVPLIGALACGNTAVIKPSELAPAVSALLARLLPEYLGAAVQVVEGAVEETTELLEQKFDYIFYTGNGAVGRIIMSAAARQLTPVTLELGGKSPVYVDETVDLRAAAARIAWGKYLNAGQTCVAPDYLLATPHAKAELERLLPEAIADFFGPEPALSPDYSRIVNSRHHDRLMALLDGATPVAGGDAKAEERYIAPTVLQAGPDDAVMQEEIFGPILPVLEVAGSEEAVSFINQRDKPLAFYVFSRDRETRRAFTERTSSGALCFGVPVAQLLVPGLPFGGVGPSGMGAYHGKNSIELFSHRKSILDKPLFPDTLKFIYPPFTPFKRQVITRLAARIGGGARAVQKRLKKR